MMHRTNRRLHLCTALLLCNLLFIWGNSLLPGDSSGALSEWVRSLLGSFLPPAQAPGSGHFLRKLAHFTEFACLGALLVWLHGMLGRKAASTAALALLGGFLTACVDETIQLFSPGRGPSLKDVGIDTAGAATGIFLLLLGVLAYHKKQHQHFQEEPS